MIVNWTRIGFRNLVKNRRRSLFTMTAIAFGFAAVNLFGGFTHYVYTGLENGYVYAQANGHLSIFLKGFLEQGTFDPESFLISRDKADRIVAICRDDRRIRLVTPQLNISGLVSNGNISTIMIAEGRVHSEVRQIQQMAGGFIREMKLYDGAPLGDGAGDGVGMARGLASKLKLQIGGDAIVVANSMEGFMNALDARVIQTFGAPWDLLENMMMTMPLAFAQELYATTSVDRLNILLNDGQDARAVQAALRQELKAAGLEMDVLVWDELHPSYPRTRSMFNVIFFISFLTVMVIVVMSVVNTVSTAVLERTREIGTLRALGLKRHGVVGMFVIESSLLAAIGSLVGGVLTIIVWYAVGVARPTWVPPHIPKRIPLEIHLVPEYLGVTFLCLVLLAAIAAAIPARRAAKMPIIDALGHS